jgi:hypothetical protein
MWKALSRFWETDESLSVLLVLLILFELVLPPFLGAHAPDRPGPVADTLFTLVLVVGMATVWRETRWVVRALAGLTLIALPLRWATWLDPASGLAPASVASAMLVVALLTFVVLAKVMRPGMVTSNRIQGAVAAYLLLGLVWAGAYELVALNDPAAFVGLGDRPGPTAQWIYYSLVTLTTMGYGDITPVNPLARSLAASEALTGQLYLAILISRLVALELQARNTEQPSAVSRQPSALGDRPSARARDAS